MGQHPEAGVEELALRALLLGLCNRHGALRRTAGLHHGQLRRRGPSLRHGPGAGGRQEHRLGAARRRHLQRLKHPALGLGIACRTLGGLPARRGHRPGAGRDCQLPRRTVGQSRHALPRRGDDCGGHHLQRHRLGQAAERLGRSGQQPQGSAAGRAGRRADVALLPLRGQGYGHQQLRVPGSGHAHPLFGHLHLLAGRSGQQLPLQHAGYALSLRRRARPLCGVLPRLALHAPDGLPGRRHLVPRHGVQLHRLGGGRPGRLVCPRTGCADDCRHLGRLHLA